MTLKKLFCDHVSSSAFKTIDGEKRIIGKWGQISLLDDIFDVWLVQPDLSPLTEHRITSIEKNLQLNSPLIRLTGEAYFQTRDINMVRKSFPLLGIKKKRQLSEDSKAKLRERIKEFRK